MSGHLSLPETEGTVRKPYFFTHGVGGAVVCPACASQLPGDEIDKLEAFYTASRLYMCGHCQIYIGPATKEEASAA